MALEEAVLPVILAPTAPIAFLTEADLPVGEGGFVAVVAGEVTLEALGAVDHPRTIKVPLKAIQEATLVTTQGPHKTLTIRMAMSMGPCLSSMGHQTLTVTIRVLETMKVREKLHRSFKTSGRQLYVP